MQTLIYFVTVLLYSVLVISSVASEEALLGSFSDARVSDGEYLGHILYFRTKSSRSENEFLNNVFDKFCEITARNNNFPN